MSFSFRVARKLSTIIGTNLYSCVVPLGIRSSAYSGIIATTLQSMTNEIILHIFFKLSQFGYRTRCMWEERKQRKRILSDQKQESYFLREKEGSEECAPVSIGLYHCQDEVITNWSRNLVSLNINTISGKPSLPYVLKHLFVVLLIWYFILSYFLFIYCWSLPAEYSLQGTKDDSCFIYLFIPIASHL